MTEQFFFTTAKTDQDPLAWTNHASNPTSPNLNVSNNSLSDSINETYVTAIEENDTAYLSVLEATNETTLEALHNLTLDNSKIAQENLAVNIENVESCHINESEENQVVVFTVEGSDELYGVQLVPDEEGNIHKYQFQFRTTEQGTLEAIPETIQLLPNDDDSNEQQIVLQTEEVIESIVSQNEALNDEFENINPHIQYEENPLENYDENIEENTCFDPTEQNDYEEFHVKNEPLIESKHHITFEQESYETEVQESGTFIDEEEEENTENIKTEFRGQVYLNSNVKEEAFHGNDSEDLESYHEEETIEVPVIGNEETLIPDESSFLGVDTEQVETEECITYETTSLQNNCGMLEVQHFEPESEHNDISEDDSGSDTQPEVTRFKRLFIEDKFNDDSTMDTLKQDTILHVNDEAIEQDSDNETYEITQTTHVTAEGEFVENGSFIYQYPQTITATALQQQFPQQNVDNILKPTTTESIHKGPIKTHKKQLLYYLLPHPEKENLNAEPVNNSVNIYNNIIKHNPRSVLKPQTLELKLVNNTNSSASHDQETLRHLEKMEKRFSRSKEAVQARLFNNFINKTTIPHAPVRQKRLPRKQEIKPVDTRREEEIIVQEVMVSSTGFVESVEERLKAKDKLEVVTYIELEDSDEENSKISKTVKKNCKDKEGVIEILSSDEEDVIAQNNQPTKRGRGRPKKHSVTSSSLKRDREKQNKDVISHDENSPSKKSRTESSENENDSDSGKPEITCPHCPKTFPSQNSLSTHIQHHNLENRLRRTRKSIFEFKHKCEECELTFKNSLLLSRHVCDKKNKKMQCEICHKNFKDLAALNIHVRMHNSSKVLSASQPNLSATQKTEQAPVLEVKKYNCDKCQISFKNIILLKRHVCKEDNTNRYRCRVCKMSFENFTMFNVHKRKHLKENLAQTTIAEEKQVTPKKLLTPSKKRQSLVRLKIPNKGSPSFNVIKKFSCNTCNVKFASRLLLDLHTRRNCVKTPTKSTSQRLSLNRMNSIPNLSTTISTPLDLNAQCNDCPAKFKTYTALLKHQIKEHNYSPPAKDVIMKPKKKLVRQIKDHGGIPVNARLRKAFEDLKTKLVTPRKGDGAIEIIEEDVCS